MKKKFSMIVLVLLIVSLLVIFNCQKYHGPYYCSYVIDGDTICVVINEESVKVRLIGVDTPESVASEEYEKENTPQGEEASEYTKKLLEGKMVYLKYDKDKKDDYGRTLAYVYLDDQKTMVNALLLRKGYGQLMIIEPNDKYQWWLSINQWWAKSWNKGFWDGYFQ